MARTIRWNDGVPSESAAQRKRRMREERSDRAMRDYRRAYAYANRNALSAQDFDSMARGFSPLPRGEGW